MPRQLAGCILVKPNGKILVVHNIKSNFWGFPKGHREDAEEVQTAALRELKEETGKDLCPTKIICSISARKGCLFISVGEFETICQVDGVEIDEYDWLTLDELRGKNTSKFTQAFFPKLETILQRELKK